MNTTDLRLVIQATLFATRAHKGQKRDFSEEDYIEHPLRCADRALEFGLGLRSILVLILHDTIEDTEATFLQIVKEFGADVAADVMYMSEAAKVYNYTADVTREVRKLEFIEQIRLAPSRIKANKLVDILDNTLDMCEYGHMDLRRSQRFLADKLEMVKVCEANGAVIRLMDATTSALTVLALNIDKWGAELEEEKDDAKPSGALQPE